MVESQYKVAGVQWELTEKPSCTYNVSLLISKNVTFKRVKTAWGVVSAAGEMSCRAPAGALLLLHTKQEENWWSPSDQGSLHLVIHNLKSGLPYQIVAICGTTHHSGNDSDQLPPFTITIQETLVPEFKQWSQIVDWCPIWTHDAEQTCKWKKQIKADSQDKKCMVGIHCCLFKHA